MRGTSQSGSLETLAITVNLGYASNVAYTTIHRTGVRGGRVYNFTGDNITESPAGAGNAMVGPWALDYAAFTDDSDVGTELWDSEFSGVLLDGRALKSSTSESPETVWQDLDEDEDTDDSRSVVTQGDRSATISDVLVRLYHTSCEWDKARVWTLHSDGSYDPDPEKLDDYLDALYTYDEEPDGYWHPMRHALRIPVMWAIYHCPLTPRYPGLTELIGMNTATTVIGGDLLSYGPVGLLTAMHGDVYAATHGIRLYEAALANFRPVERGMFHMPYDSAQVDTAPNPDGGGAADGFMPVASTVNAPGVDNVFALGTGVSNTPISQEAFVMDITGGANLDSPAQRARGRIYTTVLRTGRNMRASPKRVTVWHLQTCPVRILAKEAVGGGGWDHHIIGGLVSPFQGPPIRLVYHECSAHYRSR